MSTATAGSAQSQGAVSAVRNGIIAGVIGGVVFGMLMAMMNMLPMVAALVGSDNAIVGFVVHLVISAGIGGSFGLLAALLSLKGRTRLLVAGMIYGVIWWVLGALILMPLMLGMSAMVLQIGDTQWASLMGHAIFGLITGYVYAALGHRG